MNMILACLIDEVHTCLSPLPRSNIGLVLNDKLSIWGGGYLKKDIWLPDQYVPITLSEEFLYIKEKCEGTSGVALCLKTRVSIWRSGKKSQDLERK